MKVTVWTSRYEWVYGKKPRGFGTWFFKIGDNEFPIVGNYSEAKKKASQIARSNNVSAIYVLS